MGNVVIYDNLFVIVEIFWIKNGEKISFDIEESGGKFFEVNIDNLLLMIRNVSFEDVGKY